GIGRQLLTAAVERAWQMGARRVLVHTNTRDHPHALGNYQARGFRIFKEEQKYIDLPNEAAGI
ncbi:MAG: GNAT family N-acetyltransferase, partial [Planctomycetota bacterium]